MSNTKGTSAIVPPSGGGAQSGLGEKFSPDLFTGTGNFSVPVAVPAGRNGFQPELTLGYSTGNGNGVFGMGWALGIPGVTRKTSKGIPVYNDNEDVFILSGAEDLVEVESEKLKVKSEKWGDIIVTATQYRPRTEGLFARITHYKKSNGENYWEVRSKDGLISIYDQTVANPENRNAIFAWHLGKTIDAFGNEIVYEYARELVLSTTNAQPHSYDQLYLSAIKYAQYYEDNQKKYLCEVRFNYEERPDAFSVYRQGFEMRTTKRCKNIETFTHAEQTQKVKTYHFNYLTDLPLNGTSLLQNVSVEGHSENESEWMPPLEFGYSTFQPSVRSLEKITGTIPLLSLAQPGFELTDVTGNGLPDLLQMDGTGARYWTNKGNGYFSPPRTMNVSPSIHLGDAGVQMIDANGDGRSDLLVNNGIQAGYFSGNFDSVWDEKSYRPYTKIPSFRFDDPEVQFMDLNGDGITDVLRNGVKFECFFNDPEKGFDKMRVADKTFANFSFADPRIRFADMTGDGLQDIVFLSSGKVQYWPNLGYGRFGKPVTMKNAPHFPEKEEFKPQQILLGDLDGDGQADIAFVDNNKVILYVNQSGNSFSQGIRINGTPVIHGEGSLRLVDIMGTGQAGILWSQISALPTEGRMFFLDFTGGNKPYLLQEMNNNMGSITRVEYGSSIHHFLRDEKKPLTRWKTQLPFPVQVVNRVEILDLLSGGKLATQYSYHNGYWDGAEREFRGFAQVDAQDTETFGKLKENSEKIKVESEKWGDVLVNNLMNSTEQYSLPILTKSWFNPGPVGQDYARWEELDFSYQYWQGDKNVLERSQATKQLLASLPRRARRDALRTLRGTLLRSETYALDGSTLQDIPYTVTENLMEVRLESEQLKVNSEKIKVNSEQFFTFHSSLFIFFPFSVGQRTTQYERGIDPMHSFSFTRDYDQYGNAIGQLSVGLPRGANPLSGGNGNYLGTYSESEYIYKDIANGQYMVDRVKRAVSYDATRPAGNTTIFAYRDAVFNSNTMPVIGCSLNFYDGNAFEGLPYGQIGDFGVPVRSETLVITDDIITDAYGANTPECFKSTPDWSSANGYPTAFEGLLQNDDERLGYKDRQAGYPNHISGWYAEGGRMQYDFQDNLITNPVGLVLESKDVFDNRSTIEYDEYQLLPVNTKQYLNATDFLETKAEYDYRTFQANKVTDPNDNISVFDFSPLGLLKATAVIGKGTEGDYKSSTGNFYDRYAPSVQMEYDFFAFKNEANPVWVKTIQREEHYQQNPDSETILKVEYSDGFGRLLQTRAQAEDVIFGNQTFGTSGLSADQNAQNSSATGIERDENDPLNVVVSGWKIYNNKGKVVEQYEPFFDKGFDYVLPQLSTTGGMIAPQLGVKIKMYYDPLERVVKTVNPDNSEQRVIFGVPNALNTPDKFTPTPWENYAYDANDLAPLTNPSSNVPSTHYYTPKSSLIDALGRTIQTTEHKAHYNADAAAYEDVMMKYHYDIRGNLLEVRDPYNRKVFEHKYDLRPPQKDDNGEEQPLPPLWTRHIDSGESTVVFDVMGKVVESEDAKGARTLNVFGVMNRATYSWAKDTSLESFTIRHAIIYGDDENHGPLNPKTTNHLGQPYKNYDDSGLDTILEYDFKGNVVDAQKQVIKDSLLLNAINAGASNNWEVTPYIVDWTTAPWSEETNLLEGDYQTNVVFDALNRPTETTYPADIDNNRKVATTTYNRAGALERITFDGTDYINHIAYNAKGDVIMTAYGNGIMTRQLYDNRTFLLKRTRTSSYIQTGWTFADNAGVKEDKIFSFDLMGNILQTHDKCTDCGFSATPDELTRNFAYDPLYRLLNATGRESNTQSSSVIWNDAPIAQVPNAQNSRAYTQAFQYDKLGNILKKIHTATGNSFTRRYNYQSGANKLTDIDNNQSVPTVIADFTYDTVGNQTMCQTERRYEWDYGNRLKAFYNQTGTGVEPSVYAVYLYDGGGNRTKKLVRKQGGDWESVTYIGGTFEYHKKGLEEKNYTQIANVEIRTGSFSGDVSDSVLYQMKDHLGSVGLRINHSGTTIDREEYYPFGDSSLRTFSKKRYRYCGKEKDEESGLYYYGARYYMSWACRFISIDPLAHDYMHLTPYNYAGNKPISYYDIDGMQGSGEPQTNKSTSKPEPAVSTYHAPSTKIEINLNLPKIESSTIVSPNTKEAALLSKDIYRYSNLTANSTTVIRQENQKKVKGTDYILQQVSVGKDGFTAGLYKRTLNGTETFALVFAGSDQVKDWVTNFEQGAGILSSQYDMAYRMAQLYKDYSNITFIGHSLGGGLASLAALSTNKPAITFNAAGLSEGTKEIYKISDVSTSKIEAYVIKGEILNHLLGPIGQGAVGNKHSLTSTMYLESFSEFVDKYSEKIILPRNYWKKLYNAYVLNFRIKNHDIDMVIKALKNSK